MAKIKTALINFFFWAFALNPQRVFASIFQGGGGGESGGYDTQTGVDFLGGSHDAEGNLITPGSLEGSGILNEQSVITLVLKYVSFILPFLALAAFIGYVYAGILYVANFGNEDMTQKAKKIIIFCTIGLILLILSFTIVNLLTTLLPNALNTPAG